MADSCEQLRSILACFPGMVFATDQRGVLTLLQGRTFVAAGTNSASSLLGESIFDIFRNQPAILHGVTRALEGQPCNATAGLGDLVMEFWCAPYCDTSGGVAGVVGSAVDITERLKTREAFRQTREMLEAVINSSPLGLAVVDLEGKVRLWNPAAERKYGWTRDEVLGQRMPIVNPGDPEKDLTTIQRILGQGSITDEEHLTFRRDGSSVPVSLSGAALHSSAGTVTGAMFIAMDLTERKRAEEALQEAKLRAEAASRAKSQFLANMSHEIRTPMNAVLGMLQLALDTPLTPEQQHYLNVARGGAESLMGLLNDILDYSQIEARSLVLSPTNFSPRALTAEVAEALSVQAHSKGLELICQLAPSLPARACGDAQRLRQVLTNLLANAIKFTPNGEVSVAAGLESETQDSVCVRFQVSDTGIGVPSDRIDGLFDPFVQGDGSSTRRFGGVGLGLAISRQLVEMMGGQIGVESEFGKGSTFWFTATFGKAAGTDDDQPFEAPKLDAMKALVVDDSGANRNLVGMLLKSWGARCHMACDGHTTFAALRRAERAGDPFHLVLVDSTLPELSGEELGRQIAADPELRCTVLLMAPPGRDFDPRQIGHAGFDGYLWKPVLDYRLAMAIECALMGKGTASGCLSPQTELPGRIPARRKRVLVAEDDPAGREIAMAMIERLGYDADPANNGAEAITALQEAMYDGVLMDCEMPEMDGLEAAARIRGWRAGAHNAGIPIIALTAHARPSDRERCLRAGMNDFLSKPVDASDLALALSRWIGAAALPVSGGAGSEADSLTERTCSIREPAEGLVAQFLEETPGRMTQLKNRIADCDGAGTRAHARQLRIAATSVSAQSLCALATAVEEAGMHGRFGHAAGLLPQMEEQFRQFARAAQPRA